MPLTESQETEIAVLRGTTATTARPTVPALETLIHTAVPVLDHGFIRVVDYMGDDPAIVQAARVSYGRGTRRPSEDRGLIRYLMRHRHTTPFEMCEIKLHVKLPIFVARQWIRHRTANVNEYSARYSILDREFYIPAAEQLAIQSSTNRQGRGDVVSTDQAIRILKLLRDTANSSYDTYETLLNEDDKGEARDPELPMLARELARMSLSLNSYTQWYWKTDLHNLFHFLGLRADPHAQYEIRVYAQEMLEIAKAWVPIATEAFFDYRAGSFTLSAQMLDVVRGLIAGKPVSQKSSGLTKREWDELMTGLRYEDSEKVPVEA